MKYWLLKNNINFSEFPENTVSINTVVYNYPQKYGDIIYGTARGSGYNKIQYNSTAPFFLGYGEQILPILWTSDTNDYSKNYCFGYGYRLLSVNSGWEVPQDLYLYADLIQSKTIKGKWLFNNNAQLPTEKLWTSYVFASIGNDDIDVLDIDALSFDRQDYLNPDFPITRNCYWVIAHEDVIMEGTFDITKNAYIDFGDVEVEVPEIFYNWIMNNSVPVDRKTKLTIYNQTGDNIVKQYSEGSLVDFKEIQGIVKEIKSYEANSYNILNLYTDGDREYETSTQSNSSLNNIFLGYSLEPDGEVIIEPNFEEIKVISQNNEINLFEHYMKTDLVYKVEVNGEETQLTNEGDIVKEVYVERKTNTSCEIKLIYNNKSTETFEVNIVPPIDTNTFMGFSTLDLDSYAEKDVNIVFGTNNVYLDSSTTFHAVFVEYPTPEIINFFRYNCEKNKVDKTKNLMLFGTVVGTTRSVTDIIKPTIMITDNEDVMFLRNKVNYCYIPSFGRYYFIDSFELVRDKVYNLHLSCDVLMTYKEYIYTYDAYISRQEIIYNNRLFDDKVGMCAGQTVDRIEFPNDVLAESNTADAKCVLIQTLSTRATTINGDILPDATIDGIDYPYQNPFNDSHAKYLIKPSQYSWFQNGMLNTSLFSDIDWFYQDPKNMVKSITLYPFDIERLGKLSTSVYYSLYVPISVGENITVRTTDGSAVYGDLIQRADIVFDFGEADLTEWGSNFKNYEPYTSYSVHIPFIGVRKLLAEQIVGHKFRLIGYLDLNTSILTVNGIVDGKYVCLSERQIIGVNFPFTSSSLNDLFKGVFSSTVSGISSILAGNVSNGATTMANGLINNLNVNYTTTQYQGEFSCWHTERKAFLLITKKDTTDDGKFFAKLYGKPLGKVVNLSTLRDKGYTEISNIHLEARGGWLSEEATEIETLLKSGVIL